MFYFNDKANIKMSSCKAEVVKHIKKKNLCPERGISVYTVIVFCVIVSSVLQHLKYDYFRVNSNEHNLLFGFCSDLTSSLLSGDAHIFIHVSTTRCSEKHSKQRKTQISYIISLK